MHTVSRALRNDLKFIAGMIPAGATVLDIGCGEGELLAYLVNKREASARGIELSQEKVSKAVEAGLSVIQGDADTDLHYYPDDAFDFAILSLTLQAMRHPEAVLQEMLRIARQAIVAFPNFGYWRNRAYLLFRGEMPVTRHIPFEWYNTPNIHFCTIRDFMRLCETLGFQIEKRYYISASGAAVPFSGGLTRANLMGREGVFIVKRKE